MALTQREQARYTELAAMEESDSALSSSGDSHHGAAATEIGRDLLLAALGSQEAVDKATGGRPRIDGPGDGESPTIRARVSWRQKEQIRALRSQLSLKHDSDVVRAALDEYAAHHLRAEA